MTILKKEEMSETQFSRMQSTMAMDVTKKTSRDRMKAYTLEFKWINEWVWKGCVEPDEFFNNIDNMDKNRHKQFPSPVDLLDDCIKGINDCFNDKIVLSVYNEGEENISSQRGHVENHNLYLIMMDFVRRLHFQNQCFTKKIRKKLKNAMSVDFEKFKLLDFYDELVELGPYKKEKETPANKVNDALNNPKNPKNPKNQRFSKEVWAEKLEKAKAGNYCVKCDKKECLAWKKQEGKRLK
jgi:hypothetical protein